jgi:outer membrane protein assembly factor BamB
MTTLSTFVEGDCGSVTFDARGRIVTVCVGLEGPKLVMLDAATLEVLAASPLPPRIPTSASIFTDFAGGGYFYLDDRDRAVIPTTTRHLYVMAETDGPGFTLERDHDLTGAIPPGDKIISALPDWAGRIWAVSTGGVVAVVDPAGGEVRRLDLGEPIGNSIAVDDDGGVYVVTEKALYRLDAGDGGRPTVTWREPYGSDGRQKPGQSQRGSGTTPTVMGDGWVAITDGEDPINVLVLRRGRSVEGPRLVCRAPLFDKGASATDQSLIATSRSIVAENNYGYTGPASVMRGARTSPGLQRVDVGRDGRCRTAWRSGEAAPTVVPKLSTSTGLVYTYTLGDGGDDPWYLTAIDFATGETVWKRHTGDGLGFNNNYAPVTIGPDGTAYVGVLGGLVAVRDGPPDAVTRTG